jgi:hypothetical protein
MTKPARAPNSQPRLTAQEDAILWAARIEGLGPTVKAVLLALCAEVKARGEDGGWIAYPSLTQLAIKAEVNRATAVRAIQKLMGLKLLSRVGGNIKGDTTVYTLTGKRESGPRCNTHLGAENTQVSPAPRRTVHHKSKESPSPVSDSRIVKGGGGRPPAPEPNGPGDPGKRNGRPAALTLWPAAQPSPPQEVINKHARWWSAVIREERAPQGDDEFRDIVRDPERAALLEAGLTHVGGWTCIRGTRERPRDASFARDAFLKYLREHDPLYARAVKEATRVSPAAPKPKAKAARASPG